MTEVIREIAYVNDVKTIKETPIDEYDWPKSDPDVVRKKRDKLLAECDWTQVADVSVDQTAWATYRQVLRDVPEQAGFPDDVEWPAKPL